MLRGLFVTGTDTGVGKTVVSAALLHRYRISLPADQEKSPAGQEKIPLRYWKPVQTGFGQDDDTAEFRRLTSCADGEVLSAGIRLPDPVSPHLAAELAGVPITIEGLQRLLPSDPGSFRWIVEGAGGPLVPLNERHLIIDLIRALALPVLVVARSTLGTINHTLLTLEALRARSIFILGVVMVGEKNPPNRVAIERYGHVQVLGELSPLNPLDAHSLGSWACAQLDSQARLLEFLA